MGGGLVTGQTGQGQHFPHEIGVVVKPDAERIPRLIGDAGLFQVDLDVTDVLGGVAAGDLLVDGEPCREGVLLVILAVADGRLHGACHAGTGTARGEGRGNGLDRLLAPGHGGVLVVHVQARELINTLGPGLGQEVVEILAGLAEEFVGAVTQAQYGELEAVQLANLALLELLEQIDRALRRLTLSVSAHDHQQVGLFLELLGLVVRHGDKGHRQAAGLGLCLDGAGHALGIAGLGSVEDGEAAAGGRGLGAAGRNGLDAGLGEAVEITADPGQLLGIEGGENLVELALLFVRERAQDGGCQWHHTCLPWSDFWSG